MNIQAFCQNMYSIAGHQKKLRYRRSYTHTSNSDENTDIDGISM